MRRTKINNRATKLFAVRLNQEGKTLDAPEHQAQPTAVLDGANFHVAWVSLPDADAKVNKA
jgi:hypothetical protein